MSEVVEPSWEVFGVCNRCGADDGYPCVNLQYLAKGWPLDQKVKPMRNPHPGRKKVRN